MTLLFSIFILWNVGQGQFSTFVTPQECIHFDAGGEISVTKKVKKLCFTKMNLIYLSHWDLDHVSWVGDFHQQLFRYCVIPPQQQPTKKFAKKIFRKLQICTRDQQNPLPQLLFHGSTDSRARPNDQSMVYLLHNILIPGDSTSKQEHLWVKNLSHVKYLILGHHGSKSSTSKELLRHLPDLKMAFCSARKAKYGHPDHEVTERLKRRKKPILKTEDWGSIGLELPTPSMLGSRTEPNMN